MPRFRPERSPEFAHLDLVFRRKIPGNHSPCCRKREEKPAQKWRELRNLSRNIFVKSSAFSNEKRPFSRAATRVLHGRGKHFREQFKCRFYLSDGVRLHVGRGNSELIAEQPGHLFNRILHRLKPEGAIGGRPFCAPPD